MKKLFFVLFVLFWCSCKKELINLGLLNSSSSTSNYVRKGGGFPKYLIALTYDDGPDVHSLELAQYLHEQNVGATFFVNAINELSSNGDTSLRTGFLKYPILQKYLDLGHVVGNHTYAHTGTNNEELTKCQTAISNYISISNNFYLFRSPWGGFQLEQPTISDGKGNDQIRPIGISWNFDSNDWQYPTTLAAADLANTVFTRLSKRDCGAIVLMHDRNQNAIHSTYGLDETKVLVSQLKAAGYVFVFPCLNFSERQFFSSQTFGENMRLADMNADGKVDICALNDSGFVVALSNGKGFETAKLWKKNSSAINSKYATSFQVVDVTGDGKPDMLIRGAKGILVASNTGSSFGDYQRWSNEFSDSDGLSKLTAYYRTLQVLDMNGDGNADICALCDSGIVVALSNGNKFNHRQVWKAELFKDTLWRNTKYSIHFADVTGDGKPDIVARGKSGIIVAPNTGSGFADCEQWSSVNAQNCKDFSDADTWAETIKVADINGDGIADICAWGIKGAMVAFGSPNLRKFITKTAWTSTSSYSVQAAFFLGDINGDGRADLIVRENKGLEGGFAP